MHAIVQPFAARARTRNGRIVFPEGTDPRILLAAARLVGEGLARPILLGNEAAVRAAASAVGASLEGCEIVDPATSALRVDARQLLLDRKPNLDPARLDELASDPLNFGGAMVCHGQADAMIAGAVAQTAKVISAGLRTVGLSPDTSRLSSYFLMSVPNHRGLGRKDFIFADCAVNIDPTAEDLADIALATMATAARLLEEPARGAMLSFSTKGSASHASVTKVTAALELVKQRAPTLLIDGELQVDSALVPDVAARKVKDGGGVAGDANVLIFPDLNAGNIGYKLVQYMANADAIGPFFQGFSKPVCDLSRGCSVDDVIAASVILMATSN